MVKFTSHSGGHAHPKTSVMQFWEQHSILHLEKEFMNVFQSRMFASLSAPFLFFVLKPETMPLVIMLAAMNVRTQDPVAISSKQQVPCGSLWLYREVHSTKTQIAITWIIIWS